MRAPQQTVSVPVRSVARGSCEEVQTQTSQSARVHEVSHFVGHWMLLDRAPPVVSSLQGRAALFHFCFLCHCKPGFGCRGLCAKCRGIPRRKTARFPDETNATWSSDGRWRWNLAPRSQRPWTYSVPWMRGADGGAAVVGSLIWQLLQTSAVHCIIGDQ